jgi:hypothetical protein
MASLDKTIFGIFEVVFFQIRMGWWFYFVEFGMALGRDGPMSRGGHSLIGKDVFLRDQVQSISDLRGIHSTGCHEAENVIALPLWSTDHSVVTPIAVFTVASA